MIRQDRAAVALVVFGGLVAASILMQITASYEVGALATLVGAAIGAVVWKPWKRPTT